MIPFAIVLATALVSPVQARFAAAPRGTPPVAQAPDPGARRVSGMWFSPGPPRVSIRITPPAAPWHQAEIHAPNRFHAVGYLLNSTFVGVWRPIDDEGHLDPSDLGTLTVSAKGDDQLEARFGSGVPGSSERVETWTRDLIGSDSLQAPPGEQAFTEPEPLPSGRYGPSYPDYARDHHIQGVVLVGAHVDRDGLVSETRVLRSIPALDQAAADAVRQWRFTPATLNGQPVATWVPVPVKFTLH